MKSDILSEVFVEFCETQTHFDSLLSKVNPHQKSKVAVLLGSFLRRPLAIADFLGIKLAEDASAFWSQDFNELQGNSGIHQIFEALWDKWDLIPNEGTIHDFPPALMDQLVSDWGLPKTEAMARLLSQDPLTTVRLHRKSFDQQGELNPEVIEWLKDKALPKSRVGNLAPTARLFRGYAKVQKNELFQKGYYEIQDEGSQVMSLYALYPKEFAPLLVPTPRTEKGMAASKVILPELPVLTVVDACAGAGGKTLALADLMKGKGRIFAYDVYERKIRALKIRAERAGERNIQGVPMPIEELATLEKFKGTADVVLVDAPCTGYGVLRRNPDIKWNRRPSDPELRKNEMPIEELQMKVLNDYAPLVKAGGRLVYGVCTFSKKETTESVKNFLSAHREFELDSQGFTGPFETDGFYMASFIRK